GTVNDAMALGIELSPSSVLKRSIGTRRRRYIGKSSSRISATLDKTAAASQRLIPTGGQSGLLMRLATESVSSHVRMKSFPRLWNWNRRVAGVGDFYVRLNTSF